MPKQMLKLNDFSGGLNTKSSPRDVALNELTLCTNTLTNIPGLLKTSAFPTDSVASATALSHAAKGN